MKNKAWKRLVSLLIAGTMSVGCLAGCGSKEEKSTDKSSESKVESSTTEKQEESSTSEEVVEEPAELTMWVEFTSTELTDMGEIEFLQQMEEKELL